MDMNEEFLKEFNGSTTKETTKEKISIQEYSLWFSKPYQSN